MIFLPLYSFGTDELAIQGYLQKNSNIIEQAFTTRLIFSLISIILIPLTFFVLGQDTENLLFYVFAISIFSSFRFCDFYKIIFQANLTEYLLVPLRLTVFIFINVLKLLVLFFTKNWTHILYLTIIEIVFFNYSQYVIFKKHYPFERLKLYISKDFLLKCFPIFSLSITAIIFSKVDQIMIPSILDYKSLSYYSVSAKLVDLTVFFPTILLNLLYPKLIKNNNVLYARKIYALMSYISFTFILFFYIFGSFLITNLFGHNYFNASSLIGPYSISLFFFFFSLARLKIFIVNGNQFLLIPLSLFSIVLNVIFNYFFIKNFGAEGAIWATIFSQIISNFSFSLFSKPIRYSIYDLSLSIINPLKYLK